jgi:hypothetical protein
LITPDSVHHPANIREASPPRGVLGSAVASAGLLFPLNPLQDGGPAVSHEIVLNIFNGITETMTDGFRMMFVVFHNVISASQGKASSMC